MFERVIHAMLLQKLHSPILLSAVFGLLVNIFSGSKKLVTMREKSSIEWLKKRGLRLGPGGCFSAYFFSFCVDFILKDVSDIPHGCKLGMNK